ncbi:MAG: FecR domain-containing protein [Oscillospiraceae bacterium]
MKKIIIPVVVIVLALAAVVTAVLLRSKDEYRLIKVNSFEGTVTVEREDDDELDVFDGMKLIPKDTVKVMDNSFLELLADSDKHICAEENTSFELNSGGTEEDGYITIKLLYGKSLFTIDNKLDENSSFKVKTPNATMSVRGTSFSVEYNKETGETTVEVFGGKVWTSYNGKEKILEKGDVVHITSENSVQGLPVEEPKPSGSSEGIDFMISRYFQNVPDYVTAEAAKLEFYYCSDNSQPAAVANLAEPSNATSQLLQSLRDINEQYIDTVIDKISEETNAQISKEYLNMASQGRILPTDITEWYDDLPSHSVTITDNGSTTTMDFSTVTLDWLYADMTEEYAKENYSYLPMSDVNDEGRVYALVGINLTFHASGSSSAEQLLTPPPLTASDDSSSIQEPQLLTPTQNVFSTLFQYKFSDSGEYASSDVECSISMLMDAYPEQNMAGVYFTDNPDYGENWQHTPLDSAIKDIYTDYFTPHRAEIEEYLEENVDFCLDDGAPSAKDVTDWFPDTMTIPGETKDYTYDIAKVNMRILLGGANEANRELAEKAPSGCYRNDDGEYIYVAGVIFDFQTKIETTN